MPNYRRFNHSGCLFFTLVSHQRQPIFTSDLSRRCLREAIVDVRSSMPFDIDAWVLMPDHMHCLWRLPDDDHNFSIRWGRIKAGFSKRMNDAGMASAVGHSRQQRHESGYWQRRFWEHMIRDETDYQRHFDYIHGNPVRHGLVQQVADWPWSSFHRYVAEGIYSADWHCREDMPSDSFGE